MGYEQKLNNEGHKKIPHDLDSIRKDLLEEEKKIREKYGIDEKIAIYKIQGVWSFGRDHNPSYQSLEEWKNENDKYKESLDHLYDKEDPDPYHHN